MGFSIVTKLDFPNNWGLGTSSTLINNVSKKIDNRSPGKIRTPKEKERYFALIQVEILLGRKISNYINY